MTKAISFDFWDTLVKSNPAFKLNQFELLKEFDISITQERWRGLMLIAKNESNYLAENEGKHIDRRILYRRLFPTWSQLKITEFIEYSSDLFLKYPPLLKTDSDVLISKLRDSGVIVYLSSNTVFTHGQIMRKFIYEAFGLVKHNCNFSDEVGLSKPSAEMFEFPIKPIIHVGDNDLTDGKCEQYGITYAKVDRDSKILSSEEFLNQWGNIIKNGRDN